MKGFAMRAAWCVVLGGLAAAAAMGGPPDPDPVVAPAPAPAPAPAAEPESSMQLKIIELKLDVERLKFDVVKGQSSASSQKTKDELGVILQTLDSLFAKLEDMLLHA